MGGTQSTTPVSTTPPENAGPRSPPAGCPVSGAASAGGARCPVSSRNEKLNPDNMMPALQEDLAPGQETPLSRQRVQSSIPKSGEDNTWEYPSEQMFFNALRRKGKGDDVAESDVEMIVAIHNNMNERTWDLVLQYEQLHASVCGNPTLRKFMGRPHDLTPKARLKSWLGYGVPFDRHDWWVDRCGKEVRYVIDFYHDDEKSVHDTAPLLRSPDAIKSITMDARPALDSVGAAWDRVHMLALETLGIAPPLPKYTPPPAPKKREESPEMQAAREETESVQRTLEAKCTKAASVLASCDSPETCERAELALQVCMGNVVCPSLAKAFMATLADTGAGGDKAEQALEKLRACVHEFASKQ